MEPRKEVCGGGRRRVIGGGRRPVEGVAKATPRRRRGPGAEAPPGSESVAGARGSPRNLGDPASPRNEEREGLRLNNALAPGWQRSVTGGSEATDAAR